ncbi:hypothetical protein LWI28_028330 [Acer negundo]|uniref:Uncharacterized protein n=1 Tax=Acer negundo TaxID=4023 RepID=A0AAD5IX25_ACENE|nr:hypothetical protein LWI28_028330 [Acer negundo]
MLLRKVFFRRFLSEVVWICRTFGDFVHSKIPFGESLVLRQRKGQARRSKPLKKAIVRFPGTFEYEKRIREHH